MRSSGRRGGSRVEADDHLDAGDLLELLREPAAPERAEPGDEDAHAAPPQPNQTLRRRAQHVVERVLDDARGCARPPPSPGARVALLVGRDVEVHGRQDADAGTSPGSRCRARAGPNASMFAVIGEVRDVQQRREPAALEQRSASTLRRRRPRSGRSARRSASRSRRSRRDRSGGACSGRGSACRCPSCPRGTRARAAGRRAAGGTRCRGARGRRRARDHSVPTTGSARNRFSASP